MIKQAYINGFMRKCAEHGVDGRKFIYKFAGPRPSERKAIQRITSNPKTLKALTTPTAAPPRVDNPVWNPANVQAWSTGLSAAPALAYYAPSIARAAGKLITKPIGHESGWGGLHGGGDFYSTPVSILDTPVGIGGVLASPFAVIVSAMAKAEQMVRDRRLSALQRQRDANAINAGQNVEKNPLWTKDFAKLYTGSRGNLPEYDNTPAESQRPAN